MRRFYFLRQFCIGNAHFYLWVVTKPATTAGNTTNGNTTNGDSTSASSTTAGMQGGNARQHFDFGFDAVISQECSPGVCHEAGAKISCMQPPQ
jgi:hypothetical protein